MAMPTSKNARLFYRAAKQRFDDASLLYELERTTASIYLAGYSVECMLKALILSTVPSRREGEILQLFRGVRAHDYDWLMAIYRENGGTRILHDLVAHFMRVSAWSTDMRYSPARIEISEAKVFLDSVNEINQWADGRL